MKSVHWIVLGTAVVLFVLLYIVLDNKPPGYSQREQQRQLTAQATSPQVLLREADARLSDAQRNRLLALNQELSQADTPGQRSEVLRKLSAEWYRYGDAALAGHYATQVAEIEGHASAWSITGTTYSLCLQQQSIPKLRNYCANEAVAAFEKAISLEPNEVRHRVNLALVYTEQPPPDNPMTGILQLRDLLDQYPDNVMVINQLARLAIKTRQYERAIQRLEHARSLAPDNTTTLCLLSQAYEAADRLADAAPLREFCTQIQ